jgi:hypothetical protein
MTTYRNAINSGRRFAPLWRGGPADLERKFDDV